MNDEIKEILNQLEYFIEEGYEYYNDIKLNKNEVKNLLDYITNLQQENERLKEENNKSYDQISAILYNTKLADKKIRDYKSRCEKAIEYNNQIIKDTKDFYRPTTDIIYSGDALIEIATQNINILQNGSDSQ